MCKILKKFPRCYHTGEIDSSEVICEDKNLKVRFIIKEIKEYKELLEPEYFEEV